MSNRNVVLDCRDVYKEYPDVHGPLKVLSGISLQVIRGEQVAIMGRSGSGKTTLLQMLGGLDTPTAGEIWINHQPLHSFTESQLEQLRNHSLGFIYQMHHLLPEFTALENVAMPLLIRGNLPSVAKEKAAAMLSEVGLARRGHHLPNALSGGERQRVAIARALVTKPECILADEPTGNLDDESALHVLEVMQALNRAHETSLVIVTHDPVLAAKMDKTYVLHNGKLI
jgi:lipoprotein-releasing system ATP-binding protein